MQRVPSAFLPGNLVCGLGSAFPVPLLGPCALCGRRAGTAGGAAEPCAEGSALRPGVRSGVWGEVEPLEAFCLSVGVFLLFFTSDRVSSTVNSNSDFPWQHL